MMFMIPMPPTTSEIEAIPPSSRVSVALIDDAAASSWVWLKTLKSAVSVGGQVVPVAEQGRDRGAGGGHLVGIGDRDADRADGVAADEVLLDDADRDEDLVVGILEPGPALGLEDADHPERQAADRDLGCRCRWHRARGWSRSSRRGRRRAGRWSRLASVRKRALPDVVGADASGRPAVVPMTAVVVVFVPAARRSRWSRSPGRRRRSSAARRSRRRPRGSACGSSRRRRSG